MTVPNEPSWGQIGKAAAKLGAAIGTIVASCVILIGKAARSEAQQKERDRTRVRWTDANRWDRS